MQFVDFEGTYNLAFEFLHFSSIKNIRLSLYGEIYFWARVLNEGHYKTDYFTDGHQIKNSDPAAGISMDI